MEKMSSSSVSDGTMSLLKQESETHFSSGLINEKYPLSASSADARMFCCISGAGCDRPAGRFRPQSHELDTCRGGEALIEADRHKFPLLYLNILQLFDAEADISAHITFPLIW